MRQARLAALLYLLFTVLGVLLLAPAMPPFQNADEPFHLFRADQISHFTLFAKKLPNGQQGGWIDSGLPQAYAAFNKIPFDHNAKVSRGMYAVQHWGDLKPAAFSNTAIYPPFFYLPDAAALGLARALHLTVLQGVMTARIATGAAAIVMGALAVALADVAALWLYSLLLLPMSLALTAAASQDALLLVCTALAAALSRGMRQRASNTRLTATVLLLALVGMARPPYAGFALVLLMAQAPLRVRLTGIAVVLAMVLGWALLNAPHIVLPIFPAGAPFPAGTPDPAAQARGLMRAPWRLISLLSATLRVRGRDLLLSFIGEPGWLDVDLPLSYHAAAWIMLGTTFLLVFAITGRSRLRLAEWAGLAAVLSAIGGVVVIQYLTWSVPGAPVIEGLQGRYFIPPALMLALLAPGMPAPAAEGWARNRTTAARWAVLLFPVISLPVLLHAVLLRYYI